MNTRHRPFSRLIVRATVAGIASGLLGFGPAAGLAQSTFQIPAGDPPHSAAELEMLVGPIALYPDDMIGIVLPASTYPLQIVQAARFLERQSADASLEPDDEWDNSVVALLNYPEVLTLLDENIDWTWALGEAVLAQQSDVIDAIQRFRTLAYTSGNLRSDEHQVVTRDDDAIEIAPADPEVIYIPYYEPERVVVVQPRPVYYYYPRPYPVYYYPYPVGYDFGYHFGYGFFWGVTSLFDIGWHTHYVNVYHHRYYLHPYYGRTYYAPYYARRGVDININVNRVSHIWRPTEHRAARPLVGRGRVVTSNEGYVAGRARPASGGGRTTVSREQPGVVRDASGVNRKSLPEQRRTAVSSRVESTSRLTAPPQADTRRAETSSSSARARASANPPTSTRAGGRPVAKDSPSTPTGVQSSRRTIGSIATRNSAPAYQNRVVTPAPEIARSVAPQTRVRTAVPQTRSSAPIARIAEPSGSGSATRRAAATQPAPTRSNSRPPTFAAPRTQSAPRGNHSQGTRAQSARARQPGRSQR